MGLLRNSSWTDRRDHRDQETRYSKVMFGSAKKASHDVLIYLLVVKCHHFSLWFQHWFFRWWDWFIMFSMGWNCRKQKLGCLFYLRYLRDVFILSHSDCLQLERETVFEDLYFAHVLIPLSGTAVLSLVPGLFAWALSLLTVALKTSGGQTSLLVEVSEMAHEHVQNRGAKAAKGFSNS